MSTALVDFYYIDPITTMTQANDYPLPPTHHTKSKRKTNNLHSSQANASYLNSYAYDSDNADSDTMVDMESGSQTFSHTNNQIMRHRLSKSPQSTNSNNKHRYFRKNYTKFKPSQPHKYRQKTRQNPQNSVLRIIAGIILFCIACSIYYFYGDYLTISALKQNHHSIIEFIAKYPIFSPLIFILFECIIVGLTIPGATVLSMAAGLFFNQPYASFYAWFGCGSGAFLNYLFVRFICADCFKSMLKKYGEWFETFENGLKKNELLYLIYVRYVIIIPFWFVNVAAALFGCQMHNFLLSTFMATIPGALLLTTAGRGLANAFDSYSVSEEITMFGLISSMLWSKDMLLCGLMLLCCMAIPFLLKKYGGDYFDIFNDSAKENKRSQHQKYSNNDFIDFDNKRK